MSWNHNIQYHDLIVRSIPPGCQSALDVGCGTGLLARRLAAYSKEVVAIDLDQDTTSRAKAAGVSDARVVFIQGDVMSYPFDLGSFDFISAVAVLHHLPLKQALARLQSLLAAGGVLVIIGLYRNHTLQDYAWSAIALPTSWAVRRLRGHAKVAAPVQEPQETLREIEGVCHTLLPGSILRRHLFFRYSLTWRKTDAS